MPLLLRFASHSSFACGLRARLEEARNRSANQPLADCSPHPEPHPFKTFADCKPELRRSGAEERGGSGGNFPRMRQPWRNTSASFAIKGGRGRRIAPHESSEPPAIKREHTKSKIPPWRAPGRGGGVSPHKRSITPQNIHSNRPQTAEKATSISCRHGKLYRRSR